MIVRLYSTADSAAASIRHRISLRNVSLLTLTSAAVVAVFATTGVARASILFTPFGPNGEGGTVNGQVFTFGSGGEIFEIDAFLNIDGVDLNGGSPGTSAQLSTDPLPTGLLYSFSAELSPDGSDVTLRYRFVNDTDTTFPSVSFFVFIDPEIDVALNGYFNEAGIVVGTPGMGPADVSADSWEIDEPGYVFGDIFSNLLNGVLDNMNAVPSVAPDDVSMALGFQLGDLHPGQVAVIDVLLSDDGDVLGDFALQHFEPNTFSSDTLTISGVAVVPEPNAMSLCLLGFSFAGLAQMLVYGWRSPARTLRLKQP